LDREIHPHPKYSYALKDLASQYNILPKDFQYNSSSKIINNNCFHDISYTPYYSTKNNISTYSKTQFSFNKMPLNTTKLNKSEYLSSNFSPNTQSLNPKQSDLKKNSKNFIFGKFPIKKMNIPIRKLYNNQANLKIVFRVIQDVIRNFWAIEITQ